MTGEISGWGRANFTLPARPKESRGLSHSISPYLRTPSPDVSKKVTLKRQQESNLSLFSCFPLKTETITCQTVTHVALETSTALPATGSSFSRVNRRRPVSCAEPRSEGGFNPVLGTNGSTRDYSPCDSALQETLQLPGKSGTKAAMVAADPSCLLTPPNTPLTFDQMSPELTPEIPGKATVDPRRNGLSSTKTTALEGKVRLHSWWSSVHAKHLTGMHKTAGTGESIAVPL